MRLWNCIPLSLLALISSVSAASQVPWDSESEATTNSDTLVDVLNNNENYHLLLGLLQKTRLIPTLNKLEKGTIFAPTNDAIKRHSEKNTLWQSFLSDSHALIRDNVQEQLRQQLFYHLLNYSLPELPKDSSTETLKTLHFPQPQTDSSPNDPPASPPWFPIPQGLLGDQPQHLRLSSRDGSSWVGTDAFGNGGIELVKDSQTAANGILYGIADVLVPPADLEHVVNSQPSLSYFKKVLTPEIKQFLQSTPELTLFMAMDSAWEALDPLERLYLESGFASDDLRRILDMHIISEKGVRWSESLQSSTKLTTRYGSPLEITVSSEGTTVSGAKLVQPDIYASNGVLHLVSSLLIPPGAFQLTPEKYLLASHCSSFVSLLHSVNLEHLINNTDNQYTILAPRNDVLSLVTNGLPASGSPDLKRVLKYHFLPGLWKPKKLENGILLETELREVGLDDGRQVIPVEVHGTEKVSDERHITFGGAGVIEEPVEIDNAIIYFISRPLEPPVDPLQTALPSLELSSFLAAVFSTSLADVIKKMPCTTFLIPRNSAFKRLGLLVSDHLLAASSKQDLENVILHHIIDSVEYSKSLVSGSQRTFATLEGSDLQLERNDNGSVLSASGGWAGMKSALYSRNMLTETGVIHEVSDLMIPRSVELNIGKLMKAGKATTMTNMMAKAGFDWILNGTPPPEGSEWADKGLGGASWTLLCPTDDAFKKYNLTQLFEDPDTLRAIVSQHLIPTPPSLPSGSISIMDVLNNNRPMPLDQLGSYSTLLSPTSAYGDIVFKEMEDKTTAEYMVGIKNARGTDGKADWARVLSWGRTTTGTGTGGVIQINQLLFPYHPPWWIEYGPPSFVGAVGVIIICSFFYGVRVFWNRDQTEATYEPVGGFGRDGDDS